tara:strand:- start:118 stop:243 length:126 start_codon:yes stop_codon:yes gene_type:complete
MPSGAFGYVIVKLGFSILFPFDLVMDYYTFFKKGKQFCDLI